MVSPTHRAHALHHVYFVNNVAFLIKILSSLGADSYGLLAAIISLEELEGVTSSHNPGALVMQQRRRVPFQYRCIVAQAF